MAIMKRYIALKEVCHRLIKASIESLSYKYVGAYLH